MIRILHILGSLNAGGMESMVMNYYRNINREKMQFDFLVFSEKSFYDDEVLGLGGKIFRITPRRKNPFKNSRELNKFFRENNQYKMIHVHQGINYFAPLIKAKKNNIPIRIVHSHGMNPELIKKQGVLFHMVTQPLIRNNGTEFLACSEYAGKQIFGNDTNFGTMYNAIDLKKFKYNKYKREKIRNELDLMDKFVLGHVGNFTYAKNHEFLIDIFVEVIKIKKNSILLLIGDGEEKEKIKNKVVKLGIDSNVIFLGNRRNVNEILSVFDVFVFPSRYEGLPLAVVEAQVSELKCFISNNISTEVEISNLVKYIDLNINAEQWAKKIVRSCNNVLDNTKCIIETEKYDIAETSKWLEQYYLGLYSKFMEGNKRRC